MTPAGIKLGHLLLMQCSNGDRHTKLNVMMDDEDSDNILLQVMSPIYGKCANVTGKSGFQIKSKLVLSRGHRQELAHAETHVTERRSIKRRALRWLWYQNQEFY